MKKSALISKYDHQLTLKNYSENTLKAYLNGLNIFLEYLSVNQIQKVSSKELELFFHYCKKELGYSYSMMKQLLASVKILYVEVLKESIDFDFNIKMKKPSKIPVVLSENEVERFLNSFTNLKHKGIFTLIYSAGLRIGELLNVKIKDIDSGRMQIPIHQGKGQKDRYSLLSPFANITVRRLTGFVIYSYQSDKKQDLS